MTLAVPASAAVRVRRLVPADLDRVVELDARHRGRAVPEYWRRIRDQFLARDRERLRVALGAEIDGELAGFLLGEERAFEFGSEPCGWIFAIAVDPDRQRSGIASILLAEACRRFREAGLGRVRTMVRRTDVPVLSFFRAHGFAGGDFTQLEIQFRPKLDREDV
jgi:ribosomal protein S18 acetylase RimI-like enzyme